MEDDLGHLVAILLVAILVAIVARRLALPYTVGLVLIGIFFAMFDGRAHFELTHDLVFDVFLPPLLFESALSLQWRHLRADVVPILILSIIGTLLAAAFTGFALVALLQWPAAPALLFGVLIAATDPVAVIALFKDQRVGGRLRLLLESESLFNDGVAAVLFVMALSWATGRAADASGLSLIVILAEVVFGGLAIGAAVAGAAILVAGRTADRLVETALTVVAAWGSFLLAERLHVSGVLATVMAGLVMGNLGVLREAPGNLLSEAGRSFVIEFWDFAAFLANSLIFPLIGASLAAASFSDLTTTALVSIILVVLISRAITVYPLCLPLMPTRFQIPLKYQHVLWWGGLRGALALALALALPPDLPMRDAIVTAAFAVVAFSILIQGLTMPAFLRILGIKGAQ